MRPIVLTLFAFAPLFAGDDPKPDDPKAEAEKLRGTWTFSRMERDGRDMTDQAAGVEVVFRADGFSSPGIETTFTLDPSKSPRAMDITYKEGPAAGQTIKAIYKLDGDTLTICRALGAKDDRPKE